MQFLFTELKFSLDINGVSLHKTCDQIYRINYSRTIVPLKVFVFYNLNNLTKDRHFLFIALIHAFLVNTSSLH